MKEMNKITRLMYKVEITCTPSSFGDKDLAMKEFHDFLVDRQQEAVGKTAGTLLYTGIKTVDLLYDVVTVSKNNEELYMVASLSGRGLSNGLYDFEHIEEGVTEMLTKGFSFKFKPGELSVNVYLRKINLLTYGIEFLKVWYNYIKHAILNKELTS